MRRTTITKLYKKVIVHTCLTGCLFLTLWLSTTGGLIGASHPVLHQIHPSHYSISQHPTYLFLSCTQCKTVHCFIWSPVCYLSVSSVRLHKARPSSLPLYVLAVNYKMTATPGLSWGMWDLVPQPGIKPGPPALGAQSLSHWTTTEVPDIRQFLIIFS